MIDISRLDGERWTGARERSDGAVTVAVLAGQAAAAWRTGDPLDIVPPTAPGRPVVTELSYTSATMTWAPAVMRWSVRLVLPAGTVVAQSWSAAWKQTADQVTFWYDGWADPLTPGETVMLDMALAGPGQPDPASLRLNGSPAPAEVVHRSR